MYKKILIATDGSELANAGLDHGLALAKAVNAEVLILTATEAWSSLGMASEAEMGNSDAIKTYEEAAANSAKAILKNAVDRASDTGVSFDTLHVADQGAAEAILRAADDHECDLIVMASHGRRGLGRLFLGSQTGEVLAHTKKPVLVLR